MTYKLFGQDVSASKSIKHVGDTAGGTTGKLKSFGGVAAGVFGGITAAAVGSKLVDFAKDSMNAFQDVGRETIKLQRYMGGTAEDASRLASAFTMSGVDAETGAKSIGILEKHLVAGDKAAKGLGIAFKDSAGKVKPMNELLPQIADKFKNMPNGPEKTALALKLFGKGGMGMIPFLNKGSEGLKELAKSSDELGTTLSGSDLDAVKKNTMAKREFGESVKGLQIAVGRELYPAMTAFTKFLSASVLPIVRSVIGFMKEHKEIVSKVAVVVGVLVVGLGAMSKIISTITAVVRIFTAVQTALNFVMAMNPVMLIVIAVVALIAILVLAYQKCDGFRALIDAVWAGIQAAVASVVAWFTGTLVPVLQSVWQSITTAIQSFVSFFLGTVWPIIKKVINFVIGYYRFLFTIIRVVFGWIALAIGKFVGWFKTYFLAAIRIYINIVKAYFHLLWSAIQLVWNGIKTAVNVVVEWFQTSVVPRIRVAIALAKMIFQNLQTAVATVWTNITTAVSNAWTTLSGWVTKITDLFTGIKTTISDAFSGVGEALSGILTSAWNRIASTWNNLIGGKSFNIPGSNIGFTVPSLPTLASGGIATRATLAIIGEAGPEAVVPLSRAGQFGMGSGGGTIHVTVNAGAVGSKEQLARTVVEALRDAQNRGLKLGLAS
jgi:TP901 family phage tail tape measure protein